MRLIKKLQDQTVAAGSDTGDNLKLSAVPAQVAGKINYCRRLKFKVQGTATLTSVGAGAVGGTFNPARLIQQLSLQVPDVGQLVNLSGSQLLRLYRLRNAGNYPPSTVGAFSGSAGFVTGMPVTAGTIYDGVTIQGSMAAGAGATASFGFTAYWIVDFFDALARDGEDFAVPAALFANAQLKCTWNGAGVPFEALVNATGSFSGTLTTTVETIGRDDLQLPKLTTQDSVPFVGIEPNLDSVPGQITHYGIGPGNEGVFNASDANQTGASFGGSYVISEDVLPSSELYASFNSDSETDYEDHTQTTPTSRSSVIPVVFPPNSRKGQHLSYEVVPAGLKPRIRLDADASGLIVCRRYVWANGPWLGKVRSLLGIPAGAAAQLKTANGQPARKGQESILPIKVA